MRKFLMLFLSIALLLHLGGCSDPEPAVIEKLVRIGVLPDESADALRNRYAPLFEYLSRETGLEHTLIIPKDYDDLLTQFGAGKIDLAYFGGVTFVKANISHGAIPLVMRDVDSRFTSVFIVRGDSELSMQNLEGRSLAFGSKLSTSGHLMPRFFLRSEQGLEPEEHFGSIRYSGKHDRTAYWVRDGEADVGAANAEVVRTMIGDGRLQPEDIRIIWTTSPYADYVWAVHPDVPESHSLAIQQAFLKLSIEDPEHRAVLSNLGASGFYPASTKDFSLLSQVLANMEAR